MVSNISSLLRIRSALAVCAVYLMVSISMSVAMASSTSQLQLNSALSQTVSQTVSPTESSHLFSQSLAEISERVVLGAEIRDAVQQRLAQEQLEASVKLPIEKSYYSCLGPLKVSSKFNGWKTVGVSCASPEPWELMVRTYSRPLRQSSDLSDINLHGDRDAMAIPAKKKDYVRVVLLTSLQAGDIIAPTDVELETVSARKAVSGFARLDQVIGRRLKHPVNTGMAVQARNLQPNWIIEENQSVMIEHNHSGIMVVTSGKALKNGRFGELIEVQNNISGDIIQAYVNSAKKVTLLPKIGSH